MAHTSGGEAPSRLIDPRAVKSSRALRAALLTLLERKPFEETSIRDIAIEAGVHYATFFRHYATKEALLDDVATDQIDQLVALTMPVLNAQDSPSAFLALATYVDDHRELWTTLLTGGAAAAMRTEWLRVSKEVAVERAPTESWIPVELAVNCTVGLIVEIVTWWLAQEADRFSVAKVAEFLHRMVLAVSDQNDQDGKRQP